MEINKEIFEKLTGIQVPEDANEDTIRTALGERFIDRETHLKEINATFGKARGTAENKLKALIGDEGKGKSFDELVELVPAKMQTLNEQLAAAIEAGKSQPDIEQIKKERDQLREMTEAAKAKEAELLAAVENAKSDAVKQLEKAQTDAEVTRLFDASNWVDDADAIVKQGVWLTQIQGKYDFRKENGKQLVYDMEGNIVTGGTTSQLTAEQLFEKTLKETKRYKLNNGGQGSTGKPNTTTTVNGKEMNPAVAAAKEAWLAKARAQGIKI
jgi:hypothetical protein